MMMNMYQNGNVSMYNNSVFDSVRRIQTQKFIFRLKSFILAFDLDWCFFLVFEDGLNIFIVLF